MSYPSNSGISRRELADEIDALDASIKTLNDTKSAAYKDFREKLEQHGMDGRRASAELAAIKAAIVRRRKLKADPTAVRERDDLTDQILVEIMGLARAREGTADETDHDPDTGEVIEHSSQPVAPDQRVGANTVEGLAEPALVGDAQPANTKSALPIHESEAVVPGTPASQGAAPREDAETAASDLSPPVAGAPAGEEQAQAEASPVPKRQWKLSDKPHPDCLNPSQCGGFSNHARCQPCKDAAAMGQVA